VQTLLLLGAWLLASGGPGAIQGVVRQAATLHVQVVSDPGDQPVDGATVKLSAAGGGSARQATTGGDGKVTLRDLALGRYELAASKSGYVTRSFGASRHDDLPSTIVMSGREMNVAIGLPRGSVIAGTIRYPDGEPADGIVLLLWSRDGPAHRPIASALSLNSVGAITQATTDITGRYRFDGLPAGEYYIAAKPPRSPYRVLLPVSSNDPDPWYTRTYFPGTVDLAAAGAVTVAKAEERSDCDFQLQRGATFTIQGSLALPVGIPQGSLSLRVTPEVPFWSPYILDDGRFTVSDVPPGNYEIWVHSTMTLNMQIPTIPAVWGKAAVAVNGSDVSGVVIALERASTISGRLVFRDDAPSPDPRPTVKLTLDASEPVLISAPGGGRSVLIGPDGRFTFDEVSGGSYTLATVLSGPSAEHWDVESAIVNGRDVLDFGLDVNLGAAPRSEIIVTMTKSRQEIAGRLETTDPALATATIVAFPEDKTFWGTPSRRIRRAKADTQGRFSFARLPPGAYRIALVTELNPTDLSDPAFLGDLAAQSIGVTLSSGSSVTDLVIRPRGGG
jgi:Carboxypeptidase regulatory-like domain